MTSSGTHYYHMSHLFEFKQNNDEYLCRKGAAKSVGSFIYNHFNNVINENGNDDHFHFCFSCNFFVIQNNFAKFLVLLRRNEYITEMKISLSNKLIAEW